MWIEYFFDLNYSVHFVESSIFLRMTPQQKSPYIKECYAPEQCTSKPRTFLEKIFDDLSSSYYYL